MRWVLWVSFALAPWLVAAQSAFGGTSSSEMDGDMAGGTPLVGSRGKAEEAGMDARGFELGPPILVAGEREAVRRWVAAKFEGVDDPWTVRPYLVVSGGTVFQNVGWYDRPLQIGETVYERGLFFAHPGSATVHLPSPGKAFEAVIGLDRNVEAPFENGSVVFSVEAGESELFRSDVVRAETPARELHVELNGAEEFALAVGDAGDGAIGDQASWIDARVTLMDGSVFWLGDGFIGRGRGPFSTGPPFSFTYGGRDSSEFIGDWETTRESRDLDDRRTERVVTYRDPKTGLAVRCVAIEYADFPTVEWTVYLENQGTVDTPIISDLKAVDTVFERDPDNTPYWRRDQAEFELHHWRGCVAESNDYEPMRTIMRPGDDAEFSPPGTVSTEAWPYYNLEWQGQGVLVVVGWPGQWSMGFERDESIGMRVRGGQKSTRFTLHPGEEIRTPLVALQFYEGDWIRGQNVWRRWMLVHNVPRPEGDPAPPHFRFSSIRKYVDTTEENQIAGIRQCLEEGLHPDYWHIDAGWYDCNGYWPFFGTWFADPERYPRGLRAVSDYAHERGVKLLAWFVPESAHEGSWLLEHHPEWFDRGSIRFGDPVALAGITDHIDTIIKDQGIDCYRQDFAGGWGADGEDRVGISEIEYVTGMLAFWDALLERNPGLLIDMCSGGGRRNDLEAMRRAIPLWYSDNIGHTEGIQGKSYGVAFWLPAFGTMVSPSNYEFRSRMNPYPLADFDLERGVNWDFYRHAVGQWREVSTYYFGDYYPLTPHSIADDTWLAWQYDRPDLGEGMVQVFARADSYFDSARFKLRGVDPDATYVVTDLDSPDGAQTMSGRDVREVGIPVAIPKKPAAVLLTYKRVGQ